MGSRQVPGQTKQSYREAKKIEAELLEQVDRGQHRGSSSRTVGELIEHWLGWRQQVRPISLVTVQRSGSSSVAASPGSHPAAMLTVQQVAHLIRKG
jgi:hypothetical protein